MDAGEVARLLGLRCSLHRIRLRLWCWTLSRSCCRHRMWASQPSGSSA